MLDTTDEEEKMALKKSLLKYCSLDTFAMYKIFQHLTNFKDENFKIINMESI